MVNVDDVGRTREKDDGPHFGRLITRTEPSDASDSSQGARAGISIANHSSLILNR